MKVKTNETNPTPVKKLKAGILYQSEGCIFLMIEDVRNDNQNLNAIILKSESRESEVPRLTLFRHLGSEIYLYEGELTISNDDK